MHEVSFQQRLTEQEVHDLIANKENVKKSTPTYYGVIIRYDRGAGQKHHIALTGKLKGICLHGEQIPFLLYKMPERGFVWFVLYFNSVAIGLLATIFIKISADKLK